MGDVQVPMRVWEYHIAAAAAAALACVESYNKWGR